MRSFCFFLLTISIIPIVYSQSLETKAAQSPAIFASSVQITYGISPRIIMELDELFAQKGLSQKARRQKTVHLVAQFRLLQQNQGPMLSVEELIKSNITDDLAVAKILIQTSGPASPAIIAREDATVEYGINEKLFWNLYDVLDQQKVEIDNWQSRFETILAELRSLEELLSGRSDEMAREAKRLLEEGRLGAAKRMLRDRIYFNQKKQEHIKKELALSYFDYGKMMQIELKYDSTLIFFKQALNLDGDNISYSSNLGLMYHEWGKIDSAFFWFEHVLQAVDNGFESQFVDVADLYDNIGSIHFVQGNYKNAIEFFQLALRTDSLENGSAYGKKGFYYNNLAGAYQFQGNYDQAIIYFRQAIGIDTLIYGVQHQNIATYFNDLGLAYQELGEYSLAEYYLQQALKIDTSIYRFIHPSVARDYNNLGLLYSSLEEYDQAIIHMEKALEIDSLIYGSQHQSVATILANVGLIYRDIGKYDQAIFYFQQALEIDKTLFGIHHPKVGLRYNNIGNTYCELEDYDQALDYLNRALQIDSLKNGAQDPSVARDLSNIGNVFESMGNYRKALTYHWQALEICLRSYPETHPSIVSIHSRICRGASLLGRQFYRASEWDSAKTYYLIAHRSAIIWQGTDLLAICKNNLGSAYKVLGQYDSALFYLNEGIQFAQSANLRPYIQNRLQFNKASTLWKMGQKKEASLIFNQLEEYAIKNKDQKLLDDIRAEKRT